MATRDFITDAMEDLAKDTDLNFIFVGGHFGSHVRIRRSLVPSRKHLEWLKRSFDELYAELDKELPP